MTTILLIFLLVLLLGGVGLAFEALRWLLVIAIILFVFGAITGFNGRNRL